MLPDLLAPGLSAVLVGTSVAAESASRGHYYAGPRNRFWDLLWEAGLTGDEVLTPDHDRRVLEYGLGLSDLAKGRAASSDALLVGTDYDVPGFIAKVDTFKPRVVAFNGKEAARHVFKHLSEPRPPLGLSQVTIAGSQVYVLPSSSGANADPKNLAPKSSKAEWWCDLGRMLAT